MLVKQHVHMPTNHQVRRSNTTNDHKQEEQGNDDRVGRARRGVQYAKRRGGGSPARNDVLFDESKRKRSAFFGIESAGKKRVPLEAENPTCRWGSSMLRAPPVHRLRRPSSQNVSERKQATEAEAAVQQDCIKCVFDN